MINKKDIKNIIAVGLTLFAITAVSSFVLAIINEITAPKIAENLEEVRVGAMQSVMTEADGFESIDITDISLDDAIKSVDIAKNADGEKIGYAVSVASNGYGGEISMMVGIDNEFLVSGVEIISQSETPGLGARCTETEFKNQFVGKQGGLSVVKNASQDTEIDAITMATVTSKAVTNGVNIAVEAVKSIGEDK